jgi:hypothetical protein
MGQRTLSPAVFTANRETSLIKNPPRGRHGHSECRGAPHSLQSALLHEADLSGGIIFRLISGWSSRSFALDVDAEDGEKVRHHREVLDGNRHVVDAEY